MLADLKEITASERRVTFAGGHSRLLAAKG